MSGRNELLEADYVIVGAGAMGMAFADELLSAGDADMIIVDRRHRPGGHWNDAYPFIRLHGATSLYGVNSRPLGAGPRDRIGLNAGLDPLPSGAEICAYYDEVMRHRLLPSGRVIYLPMSDYADNGTVTSRVSGRRLRVKARRALVDGTYTDTKLPSTHRASFEIAARMTCIAPNALPAITTPPAGYTVIGSGKTAMDGIIWLLEQGVDADCIRWIRPRDCWVIDRISRQFSPDAIGHTMHCIASEFECAASSRSFAELFDRLEAASALMRIDTQVVPTMFRCATLSRAELAELRSVSNVVRRGHVLRIEPGEIVLKYGTVPTTRDTVHVDCTATGLSGRPARPVFEEGLIVLQMVRTCQPCFSAAMIARIETLFADVREKNEMSAPVPPPYEDKDWARMLVINAANQLKWTRNRELACWMEQSRLDGTAGVVPASLEAEAEFQSARQRIRESIGPAILNLKNLLAVPEEV
jgi:hypothetical protein